MMKRPATPQSCGSCGMKGREPLPKKRNSGKAEMQRLRRLVNRDLLAGGPAAAQRELFEQQFAEALEKYQQSHDLSQENG